jgi:hypothetical protein
MDGKIREESVKGKSIRQMGIGFQRPRITLDNYNNS